MAIPPLPPLRIKEADGSPNVIPVFNVTLSNMTLIDQGGGAVLIDGAGGTGPAGPSGTLTIGSGITGGASAGYILMVSGGPVLGQVSSAYFVNTSRSISTVYPISGGGNLSLDRTFAVDTAFLVHSGRTISTTYPLSGGGNLGADRTFFIQTGALGQILTTSGGVTGDLAWVNSSGGASGAVYAPTGGFYVAWSSDILLSAEKVLTAGSSVNITTDSTAIYINALTNAAGGITYAPTGGFYVTWSADTLLSSEKILTASDNVVVTTGASNIWISAVTSDISGKQNTITYPLGVNSGGTGQTSFTSYAILYGSGTFNVQTMPVLGSGWLVVGSAASAAPSFLAVGSHGQMLTVNTAVAGALVWANTLGGSAGAVYAATGNDYVVMNLAADLTSDYRLVQSGNSITIDTSGNLIIINAVTGGGAGGAGVSTIKIPMALMSVEVNSGNAYWTAATNGVLLDESYVVHVDSGRSISTWWCRVPYNVNSSPAWNLDISSYPTASSAGIIVLSLSGTTITQGESANGAVTGLVAGGSFGLQQIGIYTVSTMSATDFDGTLATSAGDYMKIQLIRHGNADTYNADFRVIGIDLKCLVDT